MSKKCNPPLLWLTQLVIGLFPTSRWFRLKCILLSISGVDIQPSARVYSSVRIATSGYLGIGAETHIGHQVLIAGGDAPITIGSNCDIGPRVMILSGDHEFADEGPRAAGPGYSKPINIEDGVWIGSGSLILRGVRIGRRSIICAGSVVARDLPPGSYAVGAGTSLLVHGG
jgi:acetyltransferase-like isoleucine patch superfamily enzyme